MVGVEPTLLSELDFESSTSANSITSANVESVYNNFSETNALNKTISKIIELDGSLLDATSIINPVIKIFFNPEGMEGYVVDDDKIYITFNGLKITWDSFIYDYGDSFHAFDIDNETGEKIDLGEINYHDFTMLCEDIENYIINHYESLILQHPMLTTAYVPTK